MKVSFTIRGGADLAKKLHQLPAAVGASVLKKALIAGAEPMAREAASLAPRGSGPGPHLADNIVIGTISARRQEAKERETETVVEVGPAKRPSDHFYGYFQEYGTRHHRARPFMRPAFDTKARVSLSIALHHLWVSIKLLLPSGGSANVGGRNL